MSRNSFTVLASPFPFGNFIIQYCQTTITSSTADCVAPTITTDSQGAQGDRGEEEDGEEVGTHGVRQTSLVSSL